MAATNQGERFRKAVLEEGVPALVEFWAPWCTYCRRIGPAMEQVAKQYGDRLLVAQINTDDEPELARRYGIEVIPKLMFFRDGRPQAAITAPDSKAAIDVFLAAQGAVAPPGH